MIKFVLTWLDLRMPESLVKHDFGCLREGVSGTQSVRVSGLSRADGPPHLRGRRPVRGGPNGAKCGGRVNWRISARLVERMLPALRPSHSGQNLYHRLSVLWSSEYPLADGLGYPVCRRQAAGLPRRHNHMGRHNGPPSPTVVLSTVSVTHCQLWFRNMKWKIREQTMHKS